MKDQRTHLKIKVKNLADEARTIRAEEHKLKGMDKWRLQEHRKTVVRVAARRSLIAYQFIRGRNYEASAKHDTFSRASDWPEVNRMVRKYGSEEVIMQLPELEKALKLETRAPLPPVHNEVPEVGLRMAHQR